MALLRFFLALSSSALLALAGCSAHGDPAAELPPPGTVSADTSVSLFAVDHPEQFPLTAAEAYATTPKLAIELAEKDLKSFETVKFAVQQNVVMIPGALTPTDIIAAWKLGPDFVKVVPCGHVGGDSYIRDLKAMFPSVPLIAAGGVNQRTALTSSLPAPLRSGSAAN